MALQGVPLEYREGFRQRVRILDNGCWEWMGYKQQHSQGHGIYRNQPVYRWAWEQVHGKVPEGMYMDHYLYPDDGCIGPTCTNPDHVEPVTPRQNSLRSHTSVCAIAISKTHCDSGHEFTEENTLIRKDNGKRVCRTCNRRWKGWKGGVSHRDRTHCPRGHPYDEENTSYQKNGSRRCKSCRRKTPENKKAGAR